MERNEKEIEFFISKYNNGQEKRMCSGFLWTEDYLMEEKKCLSDCKYMIAKLTEARIH